MKYLRNLSIDPYFNLALEEYFLSDEQNDDILFILWQNKPSVIIGKNQDIFSEVNLEATSQNNIEVVRRITGGGAVYHDLGNLNFTFILPLGESYVEEKIQDMINALSEYGIHLMKKGRNDLFFEDKKVSGMAQIIKEDRQMLHGTLMFDVDHDRLETVLSPSEFKLKKNGVQSVKSRVINICDVILGEKDLKDLINAIEMYFYRNYHFEKMDISKEAEVKINKIADRYKDKSWIYGQDFISVLHKKAFRNSEIQAKLDIRDNCIQQIRFEGDFIDHKDIHEIEKKLYGVPLEENTIMECLRNSNIEEYMQEFTINEICDLILG